MREGVLSSIRIGFDDGPVPSTDALLDVLGVLKICSRSTRHYAHHDAPETGVEGVDDGVMPCVATPQA